jgi:acyl dehydratase
MTVTRFLSKAPRTLPLYARAAAAAFPAARLLAFVPGEGGEILDMRLQLDGVRADPRRLAIYSSICGFPAGEHLPTTYPHILAFPLHMKLLTEGHFPFAPIGLVHIENRILQHHAIPRGEELDLHVRASGAEPHPRGASFALISEARIAGETVWEATSTMLHRSRRAHAANDDPAARHAGIEAPALDGAPRQTWALPRNLGRRYASVSGDRNPIHMHALAARALGFRGAIAHGMWTLARSIAALAAELPDAHGVEVSFRKPIVLPAAVQLSAGTAGEETAFVVRDVKHELTHLHGRVWALRGHPAGATPTRKQAP